MLAMESKLDTDVPSSCEEKFAKGVKEAQVMGLGGGRQKQMRSAMGITQEGETM